MTLYIYSEKVKLIVRVRKEIKPGSLLPWRLMLLAQTERLYG